MRTYTFSKLPVAMQALIGFAVTVTGFYVFINLELWAQGDIRFLITYALIATLYLLNGMPALAEGMMTMLYKKDEGK